MLPAPSEGSYSHHGPPLPLPSPHDRPRRLSTKHKPPATKVASSYIPRQQKVKVSRRKGPLDVQNRKKASNMRKHKCDEGHPCQRCLKSFENARSFLEPCFRDHIQDTSLVRRCNGRCNQVEADFLKYVWQEDDGIFSMEIIWCLPGTSDPIPMKEPLRIRCREFFLPEADSNSIKFEWVNTDGQLINIKQPPYAIFDTAALQADVDAYFCSNLHSMEQWIFQRICRDELALLTYREAWRLRDNGLLGNNILDLTLRLQCLSIMSQGYGTVCSSNIPGISEIDFKALGHSEYEAYDRDSRHRPLPAAINHQMDVAFVKILRRLEKECHKVLTQRVFKPKIKPWYELFLTFFVLYWNLEYIHQGADKYIRSKSGTSTQIHVSSVVKQQIKKWDDTFDIILRYWRTLLRTFVPFKVARENPEDLRTKGHLPDIESFNYMMQVVAIFDRQGVDRHAPPLTGTSSSQFSTNSKWITALFKEGGA
ncbi:hypothetical protein BU24DRAFT_346107 [Aaosphaeria arxii CBS 175.79]|uniref:Uncharacterized protein n=1 Tax=Aaosphaeria arxii CBS 175.79 TaxID=1450172 RepID=A0A6A5XX88_9PLEO|nr:uncharacterized protein BU24DRAFT_346107 [Aaosphaeria arxii CBS 175.79]KAF2017331.1 hypothetical protein BU24DRAFT_346107 [Aaosphaeria arxii CBS 175.79]